MATENPAVDCFYVYPTVSLDGSPNSDWETSEEEDFTVRSHAARLQTLCRVFAPVYRQGTITALLSQNPPGDFELAYADVLDAFKHYMANHNEGRGFVLIGHSQGTRHLKQLIQEEIDAFDALRDQLIAA